MITSDTPRTSPRAAFTLVEMLIAAALVFVLLALALPAIQAAREASRRNDCAHRLGQLSLAALKYEAAKGTFPVSMGTGWDGAYDKDQPGVGWIFNTLPYFDQQDLYDRFVGAGALVGDVPADQNCAPDTTREGVGIASASVCDLLEIQLPELLCASDNAREMKELSYFWLRPTATTNYKGVLDDTWLDPGQNNFHNDDSKYPSGIYDTLSGGPARDCHRDIRCRGIFFRQSFRKPVRMAAVLDGASYTAMVGEDIPLLNAHTVAYYSDGDWCSCNIPLNNGLTTPDPIAFRTQWGSARGFKSRHPGGIQFAYVDGSVRFLSDQSDHALFRATCTRSRGEVFAKAK
ncbi:MAG: DUF1559 domain-containing protein [Pirellulales bacterium]